MFELVGNVFVDQCNQPKQNYGIYFILSTESPDVVEYSKPPLPFCRVLKQAISQSDVWNERALCKLDKIKRRKNSHWLILWMTTNADNSDHDASLVTCSNSLQFSSFLLLLANSCSHFTCHSFGKSYWCTLSIGLSRALYTGWRMRMHTSFGLWCHETINIIQTIWYGTV